jgi:hypothetical protein
VILCFGIENQSLKVVVVSRGDFKHKQCFMIDKFGTLLESGSFIMISGFHDVVLDQSGRG